MACEQLQKATSRSVVKKDGLFVLVQETKGQKAGLMSHPGGSVEYLADQKRYETFDEAGIRETKEESGLSIAHIGVIALTFEKRRWKATLAAEYIGGELTPDPNKHPVVEAYSLEEMQRMHHAGQLVKGVHDMALRYESGLQFPMAGIDARLETMAVRLVKSTQYTAEEPALLAA